MQSKLVSFINVLRSHDVRISTSETLDAMRVISVLGYTDRNVLRAGLSQALAKTADEKATFVQCFDRFFQYRLPDAANEETSDADRIPELDPELLADADSALEQLANAKNPEIQSNLDLSGEMQANPQLQAQLHTPLMEMLRVDDRNGLSLAIAQAAEGVGLSQIQMFTQKGQYTRKILDALGEEHIRQAVVALENQGSPALQELQTFRDRLRELVRDHVEREYLLHAEGRNKQFMDEILAKAKLNNIEHHYLHRVHDLIRKMAKRLAARHSRRRRVSKRGRLDMSKTIRRGIANDGVMFDVYWKSIKKDRPQILALCDVSGSVAAYAKFLLMFLYSLYDVLPRVRSFAFSSHLGEVSELFDRHPVEKAIELVNRQYGGATDYGNSLLDFSKLALDDIGSNTTVIILGDARNNHGDPKLEVMQSIYQRAKKVIWLNPESRKLWGSGDSEMLRYQSTCHFVAECNTLQHLERIVDQLLRTNA
ncbi:MAG: VWA domain-containing protein [Gammaproteobacteria bacterium]|nr:VWA domain-containing protein [Gammaproteobacteria bacterium]